MPKVVDVDERRAALIDATSREIASRGLANVTLRSIARVNGWSTGIVTHYFSDKHELLMATFNERADRSRRAIEAATGAGVPLLDAALEAALPLDDERMVDWRVYLAYMGAAVGECELRQLHRERQRRFAATITDGIAEAVASGRFARGLDVAAEAVLDPERWPADAQRGVVQAHLRSLAGRG
jgi:AcrR family transcriptional regulator